MPNFFSLSNNQTDRIFRGAHLITALVLLFQFSGTNAKDNPNMIHEVSLEFMTHLLQSFIYSTSHPVLKGVAMLAHTMRLQSIYAYSSTNTSSFTPLVNYVDTVAHLGSTYYNLKLIFDDLYQLVDDAVVKMRAPESNKHRHAP